MNTKNSRTNPLPGLTKKSPMPKTYETRPLTEDEKKKLKGNVGSAPNPAKTAYQIGSTLIKGGKYIYNKLTS
jgi:hypothetical protein